MTVEVKEPPRWRRKNPNRLYGNQNLVGWLFCAPVVIVLGLFLVVPILMAAWVSVSDWPGNVPVFSSEVSFTGAQNYSALLTEEGLSRSDFMISIRNNFYYVLFVVPLQTILALILAAD